MLLKRKVCVCVWYLKIVICITLSIDKNKFLLVKIKEHFLHIIDNISSAKYTQKETGRFSERAVPSCVFRKGCTMCICSVVLRETYLKPIKKCLQTTSSILIAFPLFLLLSALISVCLLFIPNCFSKSISDVHWIKYPIPLFIFFTSPQGIIFLFTF